MSDTLLVDDGSQTISNKTIDTSNILTGVTMTLGSDADGDTYYRSSGSLTRLAKGTAGEIYHLSPDKGLSVKDVVKEISNKMNVVFEDATEIAEERLGQDKAYVIDSTKARSELGWNAEISFEAGVERVVSWVIDNYEEIVKEPLAYCHKE